MSDDSVEQMAKFLQRIRTQETRCVGILEEEDARQIDADLVWSQSERIAHRKAV